MLTTDAAKVTHVLMVAEANKLELPKNYQNDLKVHDLTTLNRYPEEKFIWVLREDGTHLTPLYLGVDPVWVEGFKSDDRKYYEVDSKRGELRCITHQEACLLINQPPLKELPESLTSLTAEVERILEFNHWRLFRVNETPALNNWSGWKDEFLTANNGLMYHFMNRVIDKREELMKKVQKSG